MAAYELTATETEVLELLAAGLKNDQIAEKLCFSNANVRYHLSNIYGKMGVAGRTAAVSAYLAENGSASATAAPTANVSSRTPNGEGKTYSPSQIREASKKLKALGYDSRSVNVMVTDLLNLLAE